ncbi:MAG TPA: hypothetical protein VKE70_16850 [Candidatus Solibacter sp.]|nr:hypothetical protein [Candidatus Solibacter sp.]
MRSAFRVLALCGLLLNTGIAQTDDSPTASQLAAMERHATRPTARIVWSKEVDRIEGGQARAVITALVVEDATQTPRQMRGIRIDFTSGDLTDRIYVGEPFLNRLIDGLDEISRGMGSFLSTSAASSRCFGSAAFLSAFREGAHCFHGSQCSMADGWLGFSVSAGVATFRFTGLKPAPFASAFARAMDELKLH